MPASTQRSAAPRGHTTKARSAAPTSPRGSPASRIAPAAKPARRKGQPLSPPGPQFPAERVSQVQQLFPDVVSEGRVDFDKLRAALGEAVDERPERYSFTWAGKRKAILELQRPTWGTLVPLRDESVNFDTTQNLFIEGENLEVLKLLYKAYFGRVKLIYIDPPYNTGNDFVYPDDFTDPKEAYLRFSGQKDDEGNLLTSNPESSGRYHSAWLSMMYPRLFLARQLLRDDGVIFISIDDHEVHNLRLVMNEIFGEENFVANVIWQKKFAPQNDARYFSDSHDHILLYAKQKERWNRNLLPRSEKANERYDNPDNNPRGPWASGDLLRMEHRENSVYTITSPTGKKWTPEPGTSWRHPENEMLALVADNQISFGPDGNSKPRRKRFLKEVRQGIVPETIWPHSECGHTQDGTQVFKALMAGTGAEFNNPKPVRLIQRILEISTTPTEQSVVLDFFGGSGTTAHAVLEQNRKDGGNRSFVFVQFPEPTGTKQFPTIAHISRERVRRVCQQMAKRRSGEPAFEPARQDVGFAVFKLVTSSFKPWLGADTKQADQFAQAMELFADPLVDGWKPEPVIYEVALREGFGLTARLEKLPGFKGNTVWRVTDADKGQSFRICLDDELKEATVRALALAKDDLFICRDVALTDKLAANLALQCRLKTI